MGDRKMREGVALPVDVLSRGEALTEMRNSHVAALTTMSGAEQAIDDAAERVAQALSAGATLVYAAAGSSGLMALADACELSGTFGIAAHQVRVCMAGGVPVDAMMPGETEDNASQGIADAQAMRPGDLAIIVSASGTTPYALAFAKAAQAQGNVVIGIANASGSALLMRADIAIDLDTGPEVVAGSTRLGAGTAQKVALNMISTQAGILLGHVHDGLMVNLVADNLKLRKRAQHIVARIATVSDEQAQHALERAKYDTKLAVLIAVGMDAAEASERLHNASGRLRECLPIHKHQANITN